MSPKPIAGPRPLVLIFQTDDANSEFTEQLTSLGLKWEKFEDPKEFLVRANHARPALCYIDVSQKNKDTLIIMIQTMKKVLGKNPPTVALIEKADKDMRSRALKAGAIDVIEKPTLAKAIAKASSPTVTTPEIREILSSSVEGNTEQVELPSIVNWYFSEIAPLLAGLADSIEDSYDVEFQAKFYYERLLPLREEFVNMVNSMRKNQTKADLMQCIRLYGIGNVRTLLLAARVSELTKTNLLQWNQTTGRPTTDPKRIIPYATRAVEHYGEDSRYRTVAFTAGLIMDLFHIFAEQTGGRKGTVRKQIETAFTDGIKKADRVLEASKDLKEMAMDKHIITAIMLREAGRIAMALHHEEYTEIRGKLEKKLVKPTLQHLLEKKKYGVSHNIVGALLCQGAPGLAGAYRAVLFYEYPYMLQLSKDERDQFALASACQAVV